MHEDILASFVKRLTPASSGKTLLRNCIPIAMAVVDTLLERRRYDGDPIPLTGEIECLRVLKTKAGHDIAWLEHKDLPRANFHEVPLSEDEKVASSQTKEGGIPLFSNKPAGKSFLGMSCLFRTCCSYASVET